MNYQWLCRYFTSLSVRPLSTCNNRKHQLSAREVTEEAPYKFEWTLRCSLGPKIVSLAISSLSCWTLTIRVLLECTKVITNIISTVVFRSHSVKRFKISTWLKVSYCEKKNIWTWLLEEQTLEWARPEIKQWRKSFYEAGLLLLTNQKQAWWKKELKLILKI